MDVTVQLAREHGLSDEEFEKIRTILGRDPTFVELGIFSVMWSEHCSYKSSRVHLRHFPTTGERVIIGPGENAGVVDIGDGDAIAFKMESHNHPSYIEPYQGAATGVGGILRDVFTMGARPIACLDSLRFGRPEHPKTPHLVEGVVAGIAGYGNAFGVPTVGGEVGFDASYDGNILVNAMAVGLIRKDRIFLGRAEGKGNPLIYIGAKTGRDGIHGATMASAEFDTESEARRPTVQVGDPFMEKLLLEACLELMASDVLVGIQDMGAAGLTSSSIEMAGRAGSGIELDLDRVPLRETAMTPYEIMLSESQERMILVAAKGRESEVERICEKWDIDFAVVGSVTDSGHVVVRHHGTIVADIPVAPLTEGLKYERPMQRPSWQDELQSLDPSTIPERDCLAALMQLLATPQIASKEWVYRQYDHMVRDGTVVRPGDGDAAVVRILGDARGKGIALSTDCNNRFCWLDPYEGARLTVAEAYRNVSCVGGEPLALTDCLNFGNPERPEIMWQFAECVRGLADAARALGTPVVSGNVSLYNETQVAEGDQVVARGIQPTPTVGMLGLLDDASVAVGAAFPAAGLAVALLGACTDELGGSQYLATVHGRIAGRPPRLDISVEKRVADSVRAMVRARLVASAHDCAEGGLAVALAECCFGRSPVGIDVDLASIAGVSDKMRDDALLFGEAPSRILVAFAVENEPEIRALVQGIPFTVLGRSGGDRLVIRRGARVLVDVGRPAVEQAWRDGFRRVVEG